MGRYVAKIQQQYPNHQGLKIASFDHKRPWGGFFVIKEEDAQQFSNIYFEGFNVELLRMAGKLSPKILLVKPEARLSWQYHNRRAEIWQVYKGSTGIVRSDSDIDSEMKVFNEGNQIVLQ